MSRLFVYGTLAEEDRLRVLLGRVPQSRLATLRGFRKEPHSRGPWPLAVPDRSSSIEGRLLEGLEAAEIVKLDEYEGVEEGLYLRIPTKVHVDQARVTAWVYVKG